MPEQDKLWFVKRRFGIGTDAAFTSVLIAGLVVLWHLRGGNVNLTTLAVGLAAPSIAALGVMGLLMLIPPLAGEGPLARPQTYHLPAIHAALTAFSAKAILTGPHPTTAVHEQLEPAIIWLEPNVILALFAFGWAALELTHFRNRRSPVS